MKRLSVFLLSLIMLLSVLPSTALAAPEKYDVWVLYQQVTSENKDDVLNDGTISYDPATSTLTLNGAYLIGCYPHSESRDAIFTINDLNIVLKGKNAIAATDEIFKQPTTGIGSVFGNITFSGDGSLNVTACDSTTYSAGIQANNITIKDSVAINASSGKCGTYSKYYSASGILSYASVYVLDHATVTASGISSGSHQSGIRVSKDIQIKGGTVTAFGKDAALYSPRPVETVNLSNYAGPYEVYVNTSQYDASETELVKWDRQLSLGSEESNFKYVSNVPSATPEIVNPVITKHPSSVTATVGQSFTLSVAAENADSYEWCFVAPGSNRYPDSTVSQNAAVSGQGTPTITVTPNKNWLDGWYGGDVGIFCIVSNASGGMVASDLADVIVKPVESAPVIPYVFPFTDVKSSDWFYNDVGFANRNGLINGKTPTLYKPADNMTIAEAIKLASCMHQLNKTGKVTLQNGSPNWYDSYVQYAKSNGISWNYSNYNAPVTREEYVHIFYGALPASSYKAINSVTSIPDVPSGNPYYKEILTFYNAGILTGNDKKGTFLPNSSIKRSEVAAILTRMMDDTARKTYTLIP